MENNHKFFRNIDCKYFPCHKGIEEENFNCLFCYCPLYLLGKDCGGNYKILENHGGIKDCSSCTLPHNPKFYDIVVSKLKEVNKK